MTITEKIKKKNESSDTTNGTIHLLNLPKSVPVTVPTLVFCGARHSGKTSLTNALQSLDWYGQVYEFYDVVCKASRRPSRAGEGRAIAPTADLMSLEELERFEGGFVFAHHEDDIIYAYPTSGFYQGKAPIVRVIGPRALENLVNQNTLASKLYIHITVDPSAVKDLETRIVDRLRKTEELPVPFEVNKATPEQRGRIAERLQYMRNRIRYFREQNIVDYDATFNNDALNEQDPRFYLYNDEKPEFTVTKDIALRIAEIYGRWQREIIELKKPVTILDIYHSYVTDVCVALFNCGTKRIRSGKKKGLREKIYNRAKRYYAEKYGLLPEASQNLYDLMKNICIMKYVGDKETGRFSVYLAPSEKQIKIGDVVNKTSNDFDILGVLNTYIHDTCRYPRAQFVVEGGIVKGAVWSLTDVRPKEQKQDKGKVKYQELFVGFQY